MAEIKETDLQFKYEKTKDQRQEVAYHTAVE